MRTWFMTVLAGLMVLLALTGCSSEPTNVTQVDALPDIYPA